MNHDFMERKHGRGEKCKRTEDGGTKFCDTCTNWNEYKLTQVDNTDNPGFSNNLGACCTGFMDYSTWGEGPPHYWSDCSVRELRTWASTRNWTWSTGKCLMDGNYNIYPNKMRMIYKIFEEKKRRITMIQLIHTINIYYFFFPQYSS